jgi:hypothetical protein
MAQASQITSLPEFTGDKVSRADVQLFFSHVERAKQAYNWTDAQTAGAVQTRLRGYAAEFIQARTIAGVDMSTWPLLKGVLQKAFARTKNAKLATRALTGGLQQREDEPIVGFYARVTVAMDALAYDKTAAQKAEQEYRDYLAKQEFIFVAAGMKLSYRQKLEATHPAPDNIDDLIEFVQTIEEGEMAQATSNVSAITNSQPQPSATPVPTPEPFPTTHEELLEAMKRVWNNKNNSNGPANNRGRQGNGRGGNSNQGNRETRTCFYCKKPGHLIKDCRAKARADNGGNNRRAVNEVQKNPAFEFAESLNSNGGQ